MGYFLLLQKFYELVWFDRELEMIPEVVKYPYMETLYNRVGHVVHDYMLEFIGQVVGQYLLSQGYQAMIIVNGDLGPNLGFAKSVPLGSGDFHVFALRDLGLARLPGQARRVPSRKYTCRPGH